ncbi:MAG: hotdog fold thioesterase [Methanospirillaceae archaeon]|nr:hotdog fold thioesterase [Methanospirillaceae archaeon]
MDESNTFFSDDTFAKELGIIVKTSSPGTATVALQVTDKHKNFHGTVHGGVLFSLADAAFSIACNSHGIPAVAINTSITFMKAVHQGTITAHAEEFSKNPKLGTYHVEITDENGDKIALFVGLAYRKSIRPQ